MDDLFDHLLTAPATPETINDIRQWRDRHRSVTDGYPAAIDRAMAGGFAADRPGYAFASGLLEALRTLTSATGDHTTALCATEAGGVHPRAIQTRLTLAGGAWQITGDKRFVTLATLADELLVITSQDHDPPDRNCGCRTRPCACGPLPSPDHRLAAVKVPARRRGITVTELPATPFAPEIPHAAIRFDEVEVDVAEILPGDGYTDFLKPFRTIEDLYVVAALLAWLLQVGRRCAAARSQVEAILTSLAAARAIAHADPARPATHLALAGLLARSTTLFAEVDWDQTDPATCRRWQRDRGLLEVAASARAGRRDRAWTIIGG